MRWIILAISTIIMIPLPYVGAAGILLFFLLPSIRNPPIIPDGYHYEFDPGTNGSMLVPDDTDDESPDS